MTKTTKFLIILAIASLIGTALVYQLLPASVATHFGFDGQPDRFSAKSHVFILAAIPLALTLLMTWLPKIDPKRENYQKFSGAYEIVKVAIIFFLITIHWLTILYALNHIKDISTAMILIMSALFIVLGNYMPKFKHNYFIGIRTPWTLANPISWQKTHRLGGYLFMTAGLLAIISLVLAPKAAGSVFFISLLLASLITTVYSYIVFKKSTNSAD